MKRRCGELSLEQFKSLPQEVQEHAKNILQCYDYVNIIFEYGKYKVTTAIGITTAYAPDHRIVGIAYADTIFTEAERIINYIESFHSYPANYRGKRDYRIFEGTDWNTKFELDEAGNARRVEA